MSSSGKFLILALALVLGLGACASDPVPHPSQLAAQALGPDAAAAERALALAEGGNAAAGKLAYEVCSACHLPSGFGRRDGGYPKLAGQHSTVLIKQIADIRARVRDNPSMHGFVMELRDPRDIANVAAYVEGLCIPPGNGRYTLPDAAEQVAKGRQMFARDCVDCHQAAGQGNKEKHYPVLAGQHYRYLLRQMQDIRDGFRQNSDSDMVKTIAKYKNDQLQSLSAFLASLETPGTPCETAPARK